MKSFPSSRCAPFPAGTDLRSCPASGADHAFLYSGGVMTELNSLLPRGSGWTLVDAGGINDVGQIVGIGEINGETHAFLMTPVPEPTSLVVAAIGGLILAGYTWRRRERA